MVLQTMCGLEKNVKFVTRKADLTLLILFPKNETAFNNWRVLISKLPASSAAKKGKLTSDSIYLTPVVGIGIWKYFSLCGISDI